MVNNELQDLQYIIMNPKQVNFIDVSSLDGYSIYTRSLLFVLYKAVNRLFQHQPMVAEYHISNGIFAG